MTTPPTLEEILSDIKRGFIAPSDLLHKVVFQYIHNAVEDPLSLSDGDVLPFVPSGKMIAEEDEIAKSMAKQVARLVALVNCKPIHFSPLPALRTYLKRHVREMTSPDLETRSKSALVLLVASYREARIRKELLHCGLGKALLKLTTKTPKGHLGLLTLLADKVYYDETTTSSPYLQTYYQARERFLMRVLTAEFLLLLEKDSSWRKINSKIKAIASMYQLPLSSLKDTNCTFFLKQLQSKSSFVESKHVVHPRLLSLLDKLSIHPNPLIAQEAIRCLVSLKQAIYRQTQRLT